MNITKKLLHSPVPLDTIKAGGKSYVNHLCSALMQERQWPSPASTVKTVEQNPVDQPHPVNMDLDPLNTLPLPTGTISSFVSRGHWWDITAGRNFSSWSQVLTGQTLEMWTASPINTWLLLWKVMRSIHRPAASTDTLLWQFCSLVPPVRFLLMKGWIAFPGS